MSTLRQIYFGLTMMKNYHLEMREMSGNEYLKIFLKRLDLIQDIQSLIQQLPSVRRANVTTSQSLSSPPQNLTVYPKNVYTAQEMMSEVEVVLESYFSAGIFDPVFIEETIPSLSDKAYFKIIDYILQVGSNLEKYPRATKHLDEEGLRDYFLAFLNVVSRNHSAVGEAFNKHGRTDILVQDVTGSNIFIAECKLWKGPSKVKEGLDQLLDRYVNWRDEKVALVIFNKDTLAFSEVIRKAVQEVREHPNCMQFVSERTTTSFSYLFNQSDDVCKQIKLELILFNYSQAN
jgi:hypothetical protein